MNNNDVLKKLRVALQLRDEDMVKIMALVDFRISLSEMNAFFRKEDHPNYREAGDQVLRNFLNGLIIHLRGPKAESKVATTAQHHASFCPVFEVSPCSSNLKVRSLSSRHGLGLYSGGKHLRYLVLC
jgi:hypothetical protein